MLDGFSVLALGALGLFFGAQPGHELLGATAAGFLGGYLAASLPRWTRAALRWLAGE